MNEYIKNSGQKKSTTSLSNGTTQQEGANTLTLKDNRPVAVVQRKLQELAAKSFSVQKLVQFQAMANNNSGMKALQNHITDFHVAPGQEQQVVQPKQERVQSILQMADNGNKALEGEADVMSEKALSPIEADFTPQLSSKISSPSVVQRVIKINGKEYGINEKRQVNNTLSLILAEYGITHFIGLFKKVIEGLDGKGELNGKVFNDFRDFVDYAIENNLVTPTTRGGKPVIQRPSLNMGKRPSFNDKSIKTAREVLKVGNDSVAARHVVPSHLLGYAAEKVGKSANEMDLIKWLEDHGQDTQGTNKTILSQQIWAVLHNHLGNLWIGDSESNTAIGFVAGDIQGLIKRLVESPDPIKILEDFEPEVSKDNLGPLAKKMDDVKKIVTAVFEPIVTGYAPLLAELSAMDESFGEDEEANSARITEQIEEANEIKKQFSKELTEFWETSIEGDLWSFEPDEADTLTKIIEELQENPTLETLTNFMKLTFKNSIDQQQLK